MQNSSVYKIILISLSYFTCNIQPCLSQVYTPLNGGLISTANVVAVYFDTTTSILYAGGGIASTYTGIPVNNIAQWDGLQWDSVGAGITGGYVYCINKYRGNIIVGSSNVNATQNLCKWNGGAFVSLANVNGIGGGSVNDLNVVDTLLYISGIIANVNGTPVNGIAKYDGFTWTTYPPLENTWSYPDLRKSIMYNGELYVGGRLEVPNSSPPIYGLVKWDGSQWQKVGSGFNNQNTFIYNMALFQNKLYAIGNFSISSGSPGNCIAKWDGTSWSQCGSGLVGNVFALKEYNGYLYVGGIFQSASGGNIQSLAKWDGSQWYPVPGGTFANSASTASFSVGNNDLYICGYFDSISNTLVNNVVKYNFPLNIQNQLSRNLPLSTYPNPVVEKIKLSYNTIVQTTGDIKIYNSVGQIVYSACNINLNHAEFNVSKLPAGVYHLSVFAKDGEGGTKFVKQ